MDNKLAPWLSVLVGCVVLYFLWIIRSILTRERNARRFLPPGPPALPIIGNLLQLGGKLYESLFVLSQQYGPLMTLSLGMNTAVVVSSSAMAKEVLKTHDHIFAGRPLIRAAMVLSHHKASLVWCQDGSRRRFLKRIVNNELFTNKRLNALQHLRKDQVFQTIRLILEDSSHVKKSLNIAHMVFCLSLNLLGNMIFSTSVFHSHNPDSVEFKDVFTAILKLAGKPNLGDLFPWLGFLDLQGVTRQTTKYIKKVHELLDVFIHNRLASRSTRTEHERDSDKDFLDVLLDLEGPDLTLTDIRALILELLIAGSDTTASTIEWGMAELIRNPHTMKRVQRELDEIVGDGRRVEESDIQHLPYLQAVVKEVFRLHPSTPLLLPHKAESSIEVAGFLIPKDTQVIVNAWAIGRDPAIWKDPLKFLPERFMESGNSKMDYRGHNFELIPFGAGRRMCPGLPLASTVVHLDLASLSHAFEWSLAEGEELEMEEDFGVTIKKAIDLCAIPSPRLPSHVYNK